MIFDKQNLINLIYGDHNSDYTLVYDNIIDTTRWSEIHEIVFSYFNKYYMTTYSTGLTEYQNERPFEDDPDEIYCDEVFPREKIVTVYEK